MRILLTLFLAALFFAVRTPPALAQNDDRLTSLRIFVWPEYDDPRVLVQYEGELAAQASLPREITLLIPNQATLYATAFVDANGQLLNTDPPKIQVGGDGFTRVTVNLPAPRFHLEFYYNPLQGNPDKTMEFVYKAAQVTDKVSVEIQQPLKASNFRTEPAAVKQTQDSQGFDYAVFDYPALNADQTLRVKVSYTKADPNPSVSKTLPSNSAPAPASVPAASTSTLIPVVVAVTVLALVALGVFAWWSRENRAWGSASAVGANTRRGKRTRGEGGFCVNCGRALSAEDNFCSRCGTPRRT
jgi:hypothetical protein